MGLRNTMARGVGSPNLATTVLNLTMTALTASSPLSLASGSDLAQRSAGLALVRARPAPV